jgi:hypothetical protein
MTGEALDMSRPNVACTYDALLGGHDNYAADRDLAARIGRLCPEAREMAAANREFIARAVTWAAGQGIRQFLDLGCGYPLAPGARRNPRALRGAYEAALDACPGEVTACVDADPMVTAYITALEPPGAVAVCADLAGPEAVLADPALREVIDLSEPVCLVLGLVLNLMPGQQAREVVAGYADLIAPGSCVAVSCGRCDDEAMWQQLSEAYTAAAAYNHTPAEVAGFPAGLELVPPGLTAAQSWRGGWHDVPVTPPGPAYVLAGVAKK